MAYLRRKFASIIHMLCKPGANLCSIIQIIQMRVEPHASLSTAVWNTHPGPQALSPLFSADPAAFPFYIRPSGGTQYTVLFYVTEPSKHLAKSMENIVMAEYVHSVSSRLVVKGRVSTY
jgi:hypothetical protein